MKLSALIVVLGILTTAAGDEASVFAAPKAQIKRESFGRMPDGRPVDLYTLTNTNAVEVRITTYGAAVVTVRVPDRNGNLEDVVLGHDTLEEYLKSSSYFGVIIGRYGNRIANGKFTLNGREYALVKNNGENHLHGGINGFDKAVWSAREIRGRDGVALVLSYVSKDGEEGYPGNLRVTVAYTLTNRNELRIQYSAATDRDTVLNLSNHSYFNLAAKGNILDHELAINADQFTPVRDGLIPTGEVRSVAGTVLDFRKQSKVGARINQNDEQLLLGRGYDHNFVLRKGQRLGLAATLFDPGSGRQMEVYTTEPGVQFYTGNYLEGVKGKQGRIYHNRDGLCLETQHFPDSPNRPNFPTTVIKPGQKYSSLTIFKFSVRKK